MLNFGRREQIILLVFIGIILFGGGYKLAEKNEGDKPQVVKAISDEKDTTEENLQESGQSNVNAKKGVIKVHVVGAVEYPGLYELPEGARVNDAILKALPTGQAALDYINLADFVLDGQQITVPNREEILNQRIEGADVSTTQSSSPFSGPAATSTSSGKVNINTADETTLQNLSGIGPTLAKRIVEYRQQSGLFKSIEEIKNVKGIGDGKFEDIKDDITVR